MKKKERGRETTENTTTRVPLPPWCRLQSLLHSELNFKVWRRYRCTSQPSSFLLWKSTIPAKPPPPVNCATAFKISPPSYRNNQPNPRSYRSNQLPEQFALFCNNLQFFTIFCNIFCNILRFLQNIARIYPFHMNHSESVCTVLLQKLVSDSISGDMFRPRGLPSASLLFIFS